MEELVYLGLIIIIVSWGIIYKLYPQFPPTIIRRGRAENFASPAVAPNQPKCIQRNTDAQMILRILPLCGDEKQAATEDNPP